MSLERCRCGRLRCAHRAGSTARRAPSKEGAPHAARHRRGRRSDQCRARRRERYVREGCPVRAATRRRADGVGRCGEHVARHGPRERWSPVHGGGVLHRPERLGPGVRVRSLQLPGRVRLQARRGVGTRRDGHHGPARTGALGPGPGSSHWGRCSSRAAAAPGAVPGGRRWPSSSRCPGPLRTTTAGSPGAACPGGTRRCRRGWSARARPDGSVVG